MFGYLIAADGVLESEQLSRYRAVYCGLCRSLERCFGQGARLTLTYDMSFLVLLLSSLYEPEETAGAQRCPRHPLEKHPYNISEISDYAAHMNLALAYCKCKDDWKDERRLTALAEARTLERAYRETVRLYPRQCGAVEKALSELTALEESGREDPDAAADCCGALMEELFVLREDRWSDTLRHMAHALGRFLYLIDAAVDLEDDVRRGCYNPFRSFAGREDNAERFRDILKMQLGECLFWFDRLPLVQDAGLMQNILCVGLWYKFNQKYSKRDA
ncbi:MAG: DUF5685 family protein [Oscillospiraceae bacterium]|nr:DUF5685 family protein [Oscillospiraceae bacterium]